MYTKPNEGEGLATQPSDFYNDKGYVLLNKDRLTAVWAGVGCESNDVVVRCMCEPFYIIIDYAIMNEECTKYLPETEATAEFYRQTASVSGSVPYETYPVTNMKNVDGFFGTRYSQNRIVMTAPLGTRTYHTWIGCSLNIIDATNNPVLKILKIQLMLPTRIWDYSTSLLYPSTYGASAQRPQCAVVGQSYFDETLKKNIWYDGTDWVDITDPINTAITSKQDKLTSGTNIKTVNNQSLLGSGNITIEASKITVDTELSDTSTNPVQNLVIKKYIDDTLGTINTQLSRI